MMPLIIGRLEENNDEGDSSAVAVKPPTILPALVLFVGREVLLRID